MSEEEENKQKVIDSVKIHSPIVYDMIDYYAVENKLCEIAVVDIAHSIFVNVLSNLEFEEDILDQLLARTKQNYLMMRKHRLANERK